MKRAIVAALCGAALFPATTGAAENGRLPDKVLADIVVRGGCTELRKDAAASWNTMQLRARRKLTVNGCDSAYRTYARQVYWRSYWCNLGACGNAAVPGTSNHGWGIAVDVPWGVRLTIDDIGRRFGWCKCWSDAAHEWWHIKWRKGVWNEHPNPGPRLRFPILRRGSGGPGQRRVVKNAQRRLRVHGSNIRVTGYYGPNTAAAVAIFQAARKIKASGIVGELTWRKLRRPKVVTPPPEPTPAPEPADPITGVDVSQHQGNIDWTKVARDNIEFAIVKGSEGGDYRDPTFSRGRLEAIRKAGIVPGVYHFLRPRSDRKGGVEATFAVQTARSAGWGRGDLRLAADIESTTLGPGGTCRYLRQFSYRTLKLTGYRPLVYTYPSFAETYLAGCGEWLAKHTLWLAHYGVSRPDVPSPWEDFNRSWRIWQHTSTGRVAGISGNVDKNRLRGGQTSLKRLRMFD